MHVSSSASRRRLRCSRTWPSCCSRSSEGRLRVTAPSSRSCARAAPSSGCSGGRAATQSTGTGIRTSVCATRATWWCTRSSPRSRTSRAVALRPWCWTRTCRRRAPCARHWEKRTPSAREARRASARRARPRPTRRAWPQPSHTLAAASCCASQADCCTAAPPRWRNRSKGAASAPPFSSTSGSTTCLSASSAYRTPPRAACAAAHRTRCSGFRWIRWRRRQSRCRGRADAGRRHRRR
mmetsp:Transcript_57915/g.172208  ORF Transcript_57915/g.172208 Transcript_57915/m.172208 type:complete len:238 (-) Transcript_57915:66-779(-)